MLTCTDILRALSAWLAIFSVVIGTWGMVMFMRSLGHGGDDSGLAETVFAAGRVLGIGLVTSCSFGLVCACAGFALARIADDVETMRILAYEEK